MNNFNLLFSANQTTLHLLHAINTLQHLQKNLHYKSLIPVTPLPTVFSVPKHEQSSHTFNFKPIPNNFYSTVGNPHNNTFLSTPPVSVYSIPRSYDSVCSVPSNSHYSTYTENTESINSNCTTATCPKKFEPDDSHFAENSDNIENSVLFIPNITPTPSEDINSTNKSYYYSSNSNSEENTKQLVSPNLCITTNIATNSVDSTDRQIQLIPKLTVTSDIETHSITSNNINSPSHHLLGSFNHTTPSINSFINQCTLQHVANEDVDESYSRVNVKRSTNSVGLSCIHKPTDETVNEPITQPTSEIVQVNKSSLKLMKHDVKMKISSKDKVDKVRYNSEKLKRNGKEKSDNFYGKTIIGQNVGVNEGGGNGCESNLLDKTFGSGLLKNDYIDNITKEFNLHLDAFYSLKNNGLRIYSDLIFRLLNIYHYYTELSGNSIKKFDKLTQILIYRIKHFKDLKLNCLIYQQKNRKNVAECEIRGVIDKIVKFSRVNNVEDYGEVISILTTNPYTAD